MFEQHYNHRVKAVCFICAFLFCFLATASGADEIAHSQRAVYPVIIQAATRYQVEVEMIKAIIMVESRYDAKAVSHLGARGLMQLMPTTAEYLGVEDCFDPEQNVDAGVRYFKKLKKQFKGDVKLALAAYHAGPTRVRRSGTVPDITYTKWYIRKVLEFYQYYKKDSELFPMP